MAATDSRSPGLTDQQSRPLLVDQASVALSAGAGCGKTTVLTARFLGDLDGPNPPGLGGIAALTFTEKAARELRKRIRDRCRGRLEAGEDPARWRAVLRGLEAAPIGTFHEFCGEWLRRHAFEVGIDPDFTILDASIAATLRDEALAKCLRQWLAALDTDLIELAVAFGLTRVRQALADLLGGRSADRLDEWDGHAPEALVAAWKEAWEREGRGQLFRKVVQAAAPCLEVLRIHKGTHPKMRERQAFLLERLPDLDRLHDCPDRLAEIREQAKVQGAGTKAHWPTPEVYESVQLGFAALRTAIDAFLKKSQWDEAATLEAAEQGLRLGRLAARARRAYDDVKRAKGGLDFDDLLIKTRDLLRLRDLGEAEARLARILVDEFQDTDPVQAEILERLAGADGGSGRLFLVGDFKQSIYRFRGAQPRIFQDFRDRFPAEGRHALTENFRSVPGILHFVNALFAGTFPDPETALEARLEAGSPDATPAVEFLWANEGGTSSKASKASTHDRRVVESRWLAAWLKEGLATWTVRDPETGERRAAHAGDIALLFRAMTDVGPYESALAEEGFDYHTVGGAAFYTLPEVQDLINVLSAIEDPLDPVALSGTLRSPFFGLSDDGLYWLATARGDLVEGLEQAGTIAELSPPDRRLAGRALELLTRWRREKDRIPIARLVDRVLDESGYEAALLAEFLGARKRANVRKLVRLARPFDQQGGFTLAAFVARLRADLRRPPREEQAASTVEEGQSVRLMSIHQAKGLEFPIVVLPDLNRKTPARADSVAFHPTLGPLVRPSKDPSSESPSSTEGEPADDGTRTSLGWLIYQTLEQREEEDEALRLFYVATTRARDKLILSAGLGPDDKASSPAMLLLDERFDRLTGDCRAALPKGWTLPEVRVVPEKPPQSAGRGRSASRRPPLLEVAEAIERGSEVEDATPPRPTPPRTRFVDLDAACARPPTTARLDRLTRAILADESLKGSKDWTRVAARAARRADPLVPDPLLDEAIERLSPWIEGVIGRELAEAAAIERAIEWTMAWPADDPDATVYQGRIDLLCRDSQGNNRLFNFGDASVPDALERLRLVLSARAAEEFGLGPIAKAWRVRLGPEPSMGVEERFGDQAIEDAVRSTGHGAAPNAPVRAREPI